MVKNKIFKHSVIYGIGLGARKAIGFFLIPVYTRMLLPSEYGILSITYLYIALMMLLYSMGLNDAFMRFFTKGEYEKKDVLSTFITFRILFGSALSIIVFLVSPVLARGFLGGTQYKNIFYLSAGILFWENLISVPLILMRIKFQSVKYTAYNITRFLLNIGLNIYFVVVLKKGVMGILYGDFITVIVASLIMLFPLLHSIGKIDYKLLKSMSTYALPLLPVLLMMFSLDLTDRYILKCIRGFNLTGIYTVGYQIGAVISLYVNSFRFSWTPYFFTQKDGKNQGKILNKFFIAGLFGWFILSLFAKEIFKSFVAVKYFQGSTIVPIIAFSYLLYGMSDIFSAGLYIKEKTRYLAVIAIFPFLLNILIDILFIPRYGITAAAFSTLISYFILALLSYVVTQRFEPVRYKFLDICVITLSVLAFFFIGIRYNIYYKILVTTFVGGYLLYAFKKV